MVWVARAQDTKHITGSRYAHEVFRMPYGQNLSKTSSEYPPVHFRVMKDGRELTPSELPVQAAARGEVLRDFAEDVVFDDGTIKHLFGHAIPLHNSEGSLAGAVAAFVDITEIKQNEQALRESETRFRLMADTAPVLIWVSDTTKACTYFNAGWLRFTGRSMQEEIGFGWAEGVHPEDYDRCLQIYITAFNAREAFRMTYRLRRHDGVYRWVLDEAVPRFTPDGTFAGYIGSCIDIHDQHELYERLRVSEDRYRTLFEAIDEGFCIIEILFDAAGNPDDFRYLEVNPAFEQQTGLTNAQGKRVRELLPHLEPRWLQTYGQVAITGKPVRFEDKVEEIGRWFSLYAFRVGGHDSRSVGVLFSDITDRRRTEEALRQSEQHFRTMADTAPVILWVTDPSNACTFLSRGWYEYTGQTEDEALGFGWFDAIHPDDRESTQRTLLEATEKRAPFSIDHRLRHKDGEYRWVIDAGRPRFSENGTWLGFIGSVIDVHDRNLAAEALRKLELEHHLQERLEAERKRIGRDLHDTVRQQLVGMRMLTSSIHKRLKNQVPAEARLFEDFMEVLANTNLQVRDLITSLMPSQIGVAALPAALEREARNTERWYGILCEVSVPEAVPLEEEDVANHLFYIAREALTNAAKHSYATRIMLAVRVTETAIVLQVQDDGQGLQRGDDVSGGLGLDNMRHRAELIGAELTISSQAGTGAIVTCRLPLSPFIKCSEVSTTPLAEQFKGL